MISILIPVYNTQSYLKDCLDSVLTQTYRNLQIVLYDDGSTDNSDDICKQYARQDGRITYITARHRGIAEARRQLIAMAEGAYSLFVDSDDWIRSGTVEILVDKLTAEQADIVIYRREDQTEIVSERLFDRSQAIRDFLDHGLINASLVTKIVRTSLYRKIEFDPIINYGEDVLATWRLLNTATTILTLPDQLYHYRNNPASITNSDFNSDMYAAAAVWDKISEECRTLHPQYTHLAQLQQANSYVWVLYTALRSNTKHNDRLKTIQSKLRRCTSLISKLSVSFKGKAFAYSVSLSYTLTRVALRPFATHINPLR